jgi:hypothetical protein
MYEASEDRSSEYAAEGTVAHALAHQCWMLGCEAQVFIGTSRSCDGFTITITEEMADAVQIYLDYIESRDGAVMLETRLEHGSLENFGGTVDCIVTGPPRVTPEIVDFKYGAGVAVDAERNEQMSCYAILLQESLRYQTPVKVTIVQPRAHHADGPIRSWVAETEYLGEFVLRVADVISGNRDGELAAGDHCRFCPHKAVCPELHDLTLKVAQSEFEPGGMTPKRAAEVLAKKTAIKSYLDAVDQWVHGQLDKGVEVPGYKLVNSYGNRRYAVDADTVEKRCKAKGFGKKQIYVTELMSPAQLEKVVGKELITSLVERPHTGTTVVPVSDKREAVVRLSASDEFSGAGED